MTRDCVRVAAALLLAAIAGGCQLIAPLPGRDELCVTNADCASTPERPLCRDGACRTAQEAACTPSCLGPCGPDGCGGQCGQCRAGEACEEGSCVASCVDAPERCGARGCDEDSGTCRCARSEDCHEGFVCDTGRGECVGCVSDADCDAGAVRCRQGVCQRCRDDAACRDDDVEGRDVCESGRCVECHEGGGARGDGACVAGHGAGWKCRGTACIQCETDGECANGYCDEQRCVPGECAREGDDARCAAKFGADRPYCLADGNTFRCVRCRSRVDCPEDVACNPATHACEGQCHDHADCDGHANGELCLDGACGCDAGIPASCQAFASCGPQGYCVDCLANDECAVGQVCDHGACDACANDGECRASRYGEEARCESGTCTCTPRPCAEDTCGEFPDGCGGTLTCTCDAGEDCASQACVARPPTPKAGDACDTDADCGPSPASLGCFRPAFAGSTALPAGEGICATKGTSCGSAIAIDGFCLPSCATDSECANGYCARSPLDPAVRHCAPGCRLADATRQCPGGMHCDWYSRRCVTSAPGSTPDVTACEPGLSGCASDQACLPKASGGVCGRACSMSNAVTRCLCIRGATGDGGACAIPLNAEPPPTCLHDADCGAPNLCVAGTCRTTCDPSNGRPLSPDLVACDPATPCSQSPRGWAEGPLRIGTCRPAPVRIGQSCSTDTGCGTGEECRWAVANAPSSGTCVRAFDDPADCTKACRHACVPDPDAAQSGPSLCTRSCANRTECGPGTTCTGGGCTRTCSGVEDACNAVVASGETQNYTCTQQPSGLRCALAPAAGGPGAACVTTSGCGAGLTCAAAPFEPPTATGGLRCRATCGTAEALCFSTQTACLVASGTVVGVCLIAGTRASGEPCASHDECSAGLVCLPGASGAKCRPVCRDPGSIPAGCEGRCRTFDPTRAWPGGACDPEQAPMLAAPWCPPDTITTSESCNACDDDRDGAMDDGLGAHGTSPAMLPNTNATGEAGKVLDVVTIPRGPSGGGFVTAYLLEFSDKVVLWISWTQATGAPTSLAYRTLPRTTQTIPAGRRLALVGPYLNAGVDEFAVAYRPFEGDSLTLERFTLGTNAITEVGVKYTEAGGDFALAVQRSAPPVLGLAHVSSPSTGAVQLKAVKVASQLAIYGQQAVALPNLRSLAIAAHPGGAADRFVLVYGTADSLHTQEAAVLSSSLQTGTTQHRQQLPSGATLEALEVATAPGKGRLLAGVQARETGGLKTLYTWAADAGLASLGLKPVGSGAPPFALAVSQEGFGLLGYFDTGLSPPRAHVGFVSLEDAELRVRRPFGPEGVPAVLGIASDGVRLGLSGEYAPTGSGAVNASFVSGCH